MKQAAQARLVLLAACFLGVGCSFQPAAPPSIPPPKIIQNLTSQVEIIKARLVSAPCVSQDKPPVSGTCHTVVVKWRNRGPKPIGNVRAKIQTWDSSGNELPYSLDKISIFVAREEKDLIPAGTVYDEPVENGFLLLMGENTPVRVKVTVVYADNSTPVWEDNSSLYDPVHHEATP